MNGTTLLTFWIDTNEPLIEFALKRWSLGHHSTVDGGRRLLLQNAAMSRAVS